MKRILIILMCAISMICMYSSSNAFGEKVSIVSFNGAVKITPSGAVASVPCEKNMLLEEGTRIATGRGAYVRIAFNEAKNNIVEVKENSDVVLKLDGADKIELIDGEVFNVLKGLKQGEEFRVRTPNAVCAARGTVFDLRYSIEAGVATTTAAAVIDHFFLTLVGGETTTVEPGYEVTIKFDKIEKQVELPKEQINVYVLHANALTKEASESKTNEEDKKPSGGGPGDGGGGGTTSTTSGGTNVPSGQTRIIEVKADRFSQDTGPINVASGDTAQAETAPGILQSTGAASEGGNPTEIAGGITGQEALNTKVEETPAVGDPNKDTME